MPTEPDAFLQDCCGTYPNQGHTPWCNQGVPPVLIESRTQMSIRRACCKTLREEDHHASCPAPSLARALDHGEPKRPARLVDTGQGEVLSYRRTEPGGHVTDIHPSEIEVIRRVDIGLEDREPVRLRDVLQQLEQVLAPVSAGVIADARRMRDHAVAIDAESGSQGGALAMFEHNNPGLAALLRTVES